MFKNNWKKRAFFVITICIVLHLFFVICGDLTWETNDDELFNLIAAGAYGFRDSAYLIYQNIVYGYLLKLFYTILPSINIYVLLMLGFNSLFITLLCVESTKKLSLFYSLICTLIINLILRLNFFSVLQFTKNAFLYTAVGLYFLLAGLQEHRISKRVIGYIGIALGFCVRWQACIFALPFFFVFLSFKKYNWKYSLSICITMLVLLGSLHFINRFAYSTKGWNYYRAYNKARTALVDYGIPSYN